MMFLVVGVSKYTPEDYTNVEVPYSSARQIIVVRWPYVDVIGPLQDPDSVKAPVNKIRVEVAQMSVCEAR
jgi:hypothetical protein